MTAQKDLNQFHIVNDAGKAVSVFDDAIYKHIKSTNNIVVINGTDYIYSDGVFRPDRGGAVLKTKIRALIYPQFVKAQRIESIYKLFLMDAEIQKSMEEMNQYPARWINFQNGFWDPVNKILQPHSPAYLALNQIPHEYDPRSASGSVPIVDEWLDFIVPDPEEKEMLLQYIGYCMTRDIKQQKFLLLTGAGGTGKSTLIKLIESIIGKDNISHVSLKQLGQRFAAYGIIGKLLNSLADLETGALEDVSLIKKVLGEDPISAEQKGKDAFSTMLYAKMIFSTNELPIILSEKSNGFYRRLLILSMNRKPTEIDPYLFEKLNAGIDRFIALAVKAVQRMYENGLITEPESSKAAVNSLWAESDTVKAWLDAECRIVDRNREHPKPLALYANYCAYCEEAGRTPLQRTRFYSSLRIKGYEKAMYNGYEYFIGIELLHPFKASNHGFGADRVKAGD